MKAIDRRRRGLSCAALSLALLAGVSCARPPSLTYEVAVDPARPEAVRITLRIDGPPRDGMTLRGFATPDILRISAVEAHGADGRPLPVTRSVETIEAGDRPLDIPVLAIEGSPSSSVEVAYTASPGAREGDSHTGYTGRCEGFLGRSFGFVTGRQIFVLPRPPEAIRNITVGFRLPPGWTAVAPWRRDGGLFHPGINGNWAAEQLIAGSVGLGRFRERRLDIGHTGFRLAFEAGVSPAEEDRIVSRIESATRSIRDLFDRDLGPDYLTVVVPRAPTGDEILGEGWAAGQGGTLAPMTGNRLQRYAQQLIEAYLRYAPYRSEIARPEEFWLVDGLTNLYSWNAVAAAGLVSEKEVEQSLAVPYLTSLGVPGIERNLERLYSSGGSQRISREVLAPLTLALIDRRLRDASAGSRTLADVVARLFSGRRAGSLWAALDGLPPGDWDDFRARYVSGREMLPVERFYDLTLPRTAPEPPAGSTVRTLTVAYTGKTHGYLENCGCKVNQSGGVARRATMLARLRRKHPGLLLLDAGEAFIMPDKQNDLDLLSRGEQDLYLRTLEVMRYGAVAVGSSELAFGPEFLLEETRGRRPPFLCANIRKDGRLLAAPSARLEAGGLRVAVIGIYEPPHGREANPIYEDRTSSLVFDDPIATLRREVPKLRKDADLVFAIGRLTPTTIRSVVAQVPGLDAILSTESAAAVRLPTEPGAIPQIHQDDHPGFLGRTLVAYTSLTNYGLSSVDLGLDAAGRIASATFHDHWLREEIPDDPRIRAMLNRFYDRIGRQAAAQQSVPPLFADDPERLTGVYVGASRCAECHAAEYAQWRRTPHAGAYKTLLDRHRHFQPRCVSCHVVGYGTPHGYRIGRSGETLANVQCEVCHGPGGRHIQGPSKANIRRRVPEQVCLECHTPDHSNHFVYAERLPKVRHDSYE
ncbi:MAG TPA: multiheme c-type cytochrome [Candidatus Polarisedimenticolia bacterium]|nr:multiheme c-type cytochrome [Candidatus Polarisedimenticolia bacterium]